MSTSEFLYRQAENCLRIARSCFDLASAERLRLMAADLKAKAAELEQNGHYSRSITTVGWPSSHRGDF